MINFRKVNKMRKALVTGASRGIGYAIAKKLSQNGYAVVITGRNIKTLECVSHELGGNVLGCGGI